jgi:alpha-tubulin suppressor-like RCC1 family protein
MSTLPAERALTLLVSLCLFVACSDDASPVPPGPDQGGVDASLDAGSRDAEGEDAAGDAGADVTPLAPPELTNLPATERGAVGEADSFQVLASPGAQVRVDGGGCGFDVEVDAAGLVRWTCPPTEATCEVTVVATGPDGRAVEGALGIECVNGLPRFTTDAPAQAAEGEEVSYTPVCEDPDGADTVVTVAGDDTCGGALQGGAYVWTPDETQGGQTCLLRLLCSDGEGEEAQAVMVEVLEREQAPALDALPALAQAPWGRAGEARLTASDADLPAQALTFGLVGTTCGFDVEVSASGQVDFTCGAGVEQCEASVEVSDGGLTDQATLSIACTNTPPVASMVAITPGTIAALGTTLTCGYAFFDADADADGSSVEWLIDAQVVATGPTFDGYAGGDSVTCRVTPNDGLVDGAPQDSAPVVAPLPPVPTQVSAGEEHSCAVVAGAVKCWGRGGAGRLGDGGFADASSMVQVAGLTAGATDVSAGFDHGCAVVAGAAWCWGEGFFGRLGHGSTASSATPVAVVGLGAGVSAITAGDQHTCAIHNGAAKCWGRGQLGQLGDGLVADSAVPVQVAGLTSGVTAISAGEDHTCAIHNGAAKCWGANGSGRAGSNGSNQLDVPGQVIGLTSGVTAIAAGHDHSCAAVGGAAKCWGSNLQGKLGDGRLNVSDGGEPVQVVGLTSGVTGVSVGDRFSCAVAAGAVSCWGDDFNGQLGGASGVRSTTPVPIPELSSGVTRLDSGDDHSCVIRDDELECWGLNASGQVGDATPPGSRAPALAFSAPSGVASMSARYDRTCVVDGQQDVWCWGDGDGGALGQVPGDNDARREPVQTAGAMVTGPVRTGDEHTCAQTPSGLMCWGRNGSGQLGTTGSGAGPLPVSGPLVPLAGTTTLGGDHTCALVAGGARCWGENGDGQLGDGSTTDRGAPTPVIGLPSAPSAISAGDAHTCAVVAGAAWCWGRNGSGQLGDATTTDSAVPVQVAGLTSGVTAISAGAAHTCALHNGALECWGEGSRGRLGNGSSLDSSVPVVVGGAPGAITAVSAGGGHTCALSNGQVWCWGSNGDGQSDPSSSSSQQLSPKAVAGLPSPVDALSAGGGHTCALSNGQVWCWGNNALGQARDPADYYPTPITVAR